MSGRTFGRAGCTLLILLVFGLVSPAGKAWPQGTGQEHAEGGEGPEEVTVVGEVVDHVCYIRHNSRGVEHRKCAEYCAKLGITLAVLNEENDEILLSFPTGHANPNEKLMEYIGQRVKVTGIIHEKGGLKGIEVISIEPAGDK